jgi:hypothetical protein
MKTITILFFLLLVAPPLYAAKAKLRLLVEDGSNFMEFSESEIQNYLKKNPLLLGKDKSLSCEVSYSTEVLEGHNAKRKRMKDGSVERRVNVDCTVGTTKWIAYMSEYCSEKSDYYSEENLRFYQKTSDAVRLTIQCMSK